MGNEKTRGMKMTGRVCFCWKGSACVCVYKRACVYTVTSPSHWLLQLLLGSWDTDESFTQIRCPHALKQQFIPALTQWSRRRRSRPLWSAENFLACSNTDSWLLCSHLVTISIIHHLFLAFSQSMNHYSSLTSLTVLSLEQTAHPHRHGNSGTTAGSLVLLGVGNLNHSFPSPLHLSHTPLFTFIHFLHTDLLWRPCQYTHGVPPIAKTLIHTFIVMRMYIANERKRSWRFFIGFWISLKNKQTNKHDF